MCERVREGASGWIYSNNPRSSPGSLVVVIWRPTAIETITKPAHRETALTIEFSSLFFFFSLSLLFISPTMLLFLY